MSGLDSRKSDQMTLKAIIRVAVSKREQRWVGLTLPENQSSTRGTFVYPVYPSAELKQDGMSVIVIFVV